MNNFKTKDNLFNFYYLNVSIYFSFIWHYFLNNIENNEYFKKINHINLLLL